MVRRLVRQGSSFRPGLQSQTVFAAAGPAATSSQPGAQRDGPEQQLAAHAPAEVLEANLLVCHERGQHDGHERHRREGGNL